MKTKKEYPYYEVPTIAENISSRMAERLRQNIYNNFGGEEVYFIGLNQNDTLITGDLKLKYKTNKQKIEAIRNFTRGFIAGIKAIS